MVRSSSVINGYLRFTYTARREITQYLGDLVKISMLDGTDQYLIWKNEYCTRPLPNVIPHTLIEYINMWLHNYQEIFTFEQWVSQYEVK